MQLNVRNPELLGSDPGAYFLDAEGREAPLVVATSTGEPMFAVVGGVLVPFATYSKRPRAAGAAQPAAIKSQDGRFNASLTVSQ